MNQPNEEYLGDGLYVSFDGWQFCLRAPREEGDHMVYLEPCTLETFNRYCNETIAKLAQGTEKP